jgi:hypothetical protein
MKTPHLLDIDVEVLESGRNRNCSFPRSAA